MYLVSDISKWASSFVGMQPWILSFDGSCRNQPFGGGAKRPKGLSPREKMSGVATNVYLRKTLEKSKRRRFVNFENEGSRVVYAWGRY